MQEGQNVNRFRNMITHEDVLVDVVELQRLMELCLTAEKIRVFLKPSQRGFDIREGSVSRSGGSTSLWKRLRCRQDPAAFVG